LWIGDVDLIIMPIFYPIQPLVPVVFNVAWFVILSQLLRYSICTSILRQINNAGTNKGFRPLLQFSDEDIRQVFIYEKVIDLF
jgi:hypothetical protein